MKASVIVPVLNEAERLRRCVDALLAQTGISSFEVIIVDGGSTDRCLEAILDKPVRVLHAPGSTPGSARNIGANAARGSLLAFTDADCLPRPDWLRTMMDYLGARPELAGAGGALRHVTGTRPGLFEDWETRACYRGMITSNAAYWAEAFDAVGGFDPALKCAEDWDLAWRLECAGHRLGFCHDAVVVHDNAETGAYGAFLRKQAWYARNDIPAYVHGWHRPAGALGRGSRPFVRTAGVHAAGSALLLSIVLAPAGAALLGAWSALKARRILRAVPEARTRPFGLFAHLFAKSAMRGWGTCRGLADWVSGARPQAPRLPAPSEIPEGIVLPPPLTSSLGARVEQPEPLPRP